MPSRSNTVNSIGHAKIRTGRRLAPPLLALFLATWSHTQEPANPLSVTFRTNANLVVLDAVVKNRDGKPVTNLTKDDFTYPATVGQTTSTFL